MLYMHGREVACLHRDLKSPNLLVSAAWQVKVRRTGRRASLAVKC